MSLLFEINSNRHMWITFYGPFLTSVCVWIYVPRDWKTLSNIFLLISLMCCSYKVAFIWSLYLVLIYSIYTKSIYIYIYIYLKLHFLFGWKNVFFTTEFILNLVVVKLRESWDPSWTLIVLFRLWTQRVPHFIFIFYSAAVFIQLFRLYNLH